jgi:CIC family chloride channel protein
MLGAAYGAGVHHLMPQTAGSVGAYALVGMGAVFAGASRAPITAVVILFELTGEYSIILPLMLAIVLATAVSRLLSGDTIYTLKLRRRGIDLEGAAPGARIGAQHEGSVMDPLPSPLPASTELADAADLLSLSGYGALPVVDTSGDYLGVVTAQAVAEALAEQPDAGPAVVGQLAEPPAPVTTDQPLAQALHGLLSAAGAGVPVLDPLHGRPVGWLSHHSALRAIHTAA